MTAPVATYRLQLRDGIDFAAVTRRARYLAALGVSHAYLSPILGARAGSTHGYDVTDPTRVDPCLGGERGLRRLAQRLRSLRLGILLDIVPNHMAATPESPFFADVLRHGRASRFAPWFDIDWAGGPRGRLVLPVLGRPLDQVLARGELSVGLAAGVPVLDYFDARFPLDPRTLPDALAPVLASWRRTRARRCDAIALERLLAPLRSLPPHQSEDPEARRQRAASERPVAALGRWVRGRPARERRVRQLLARRSQGRGGRLWLARLIQAQPYCLDFWREARHRLNYRRFFDVNELIALRAEDPEVRSRTHACILELLERGEIDGLRIDHVDGLANPRAYLAWLEHATRDRHRRASRARDGAPFLLVEKILAPGERLRSDWPVAGTTGYEALNEIEDLLIDPGGLEHLDRLWRRQTRERRSFHEIARLGKRLALRDLLRADLRRLARRWSSLLQPGAARVTRLRAALEALTIELPVYRTYLEEGRPPAPEDQRLLREAHAAVRRSRELPGEAARALSGLLRPVLSGAASPASARRLGVLGPWQQLSGPAAAKGIEDTALYRYLPLCSRNEVGSDPGLSVGDAVSRFHEGARHRARRWPRGLVTVTTHDTKRSADVRARLAVLSEIPDRWEACVRRWRRAHAPLRRLPGGRTGLDASSEWLFYQTLIGIWPLPGPASPPRTPPAPELRVLETRLQDYLRKATREAKQRTDWIDPDARFEAGLQRFVAELLLGHAPVARRFRDEVTQLVAEIARPGLWNALSRTLLHLLGPGIPDLYQGDELWCFSLVDPDNRRPVDFAHRSRLLAGVRRAATLPPLERQSWLRRLVAAPEDGRIKLYLIHSLLQLRRRLAGVFLEGDYAPLPVSGTKAVHAIAFLRRDATHAVLAVAPRLPRTLTGDARRAPIGEGIWADCALDSRLPGVHTWRSPLTGTRLRGERHLPLYQLLQELPVGVWVTRLGAPSSRSRAASSRKRTTRAVQPV